MENTGTVPVTHFYYNIDIRTYERDGVVCLRGMFDKEWTDRMREASLRFIDASPASVILSALLAENFDTAVLRHACSRRV